VDRVDFRRWADALDGERDRLERRYASLLDQLARARAHDLAVDPDNLLRERVVAIITGFKRIPPGGSGAAALLGEAPMDVLIDSVVAARTCVDLAHAFRADADVDEHLEVASDCLREAVAAVFELRRTLPFLAPD
jgi:hypothetical protein